MTIRHLKIFLTVAKCGKMRKAAELLYISQPSVSQAIKELEDYYNVKLFERLAQKIHITDEGRLLLSHAQHIVDSVESMELDMKNAGKSLKIRIGASVSVGISLLDNIVHILENSLENVDVFVTVNNTSEIEKMILQSELDAAIVEGIVNDNDIIKIPTYSDELVMVAGKTHRLFNKEYINLTDLEGESLISREQGSADRNHFEQFLYEHNIHMIKKWSCTNTEAIKNAVIHGKGIAIISKLIIKKECEEGSLKILNINGINITRIINLIYHKNKYLSLPMEKLIKVCSNYK